jgi:hypothetical protein
MGWISGQLNKLTAGNMQFMTYSIEAGVLVRKLSQLTSLSLAKRANPRYFIQLCGISCQLAGCVNRVHDSRLMPNQTLVSYTLAVSAQLS